MDEILQLQRELAAAQQTASTQCLSDRNCVELVMKLQSLKLIDLIFTRSGKEYLTPSQLILEIQDELLTRGGRINLTDLPDILNVSFTHIEAALPTVTSRPSVHLIRGELITDDYFVKLVDDLNDTLMASDTGVDNLADIATRFALPANIVRDTLTQYAHRLHAEFDTSIGTITSASAVTRYKSAARGVLRAVTSVTPLSEIAAAINAPFTIVDTVVHDMLNNGDLSGSIEGRSTRAIFVPSVFTEAVVRSVVSQFMSSGIVLREMLARLHVVDVDDFANNYLSGSVVLAHCVIGPLLVELVATNAAEALSAGSWLDVLTAAPPFFPEADLPQLVARIVIAMSGTSALSPDTVDSSKVELKKPRSKRKMRPKGIVKQRQYVDTPVVAHRFVVSPNLLELIRMHIVADAETRARARARKLAERMEMVGAQVETMQTKPAPLEEPIDNSGRRAKKKSRRRAGTGDKKAKGGGSDDVEESRSVMEVPIEIPSTNDLVDIVLKDEECSKVLTTDFLDASTAGHTLLALYVDEHYSGSTLRDLYHTKANEAVQSLEREKAAAKMMREKAILGELHDALVFDKCASTLPVEELVQASRRWVLDSICIDVLCRVTDCVAQNNGVPGVGLSVAHELGSKTEKMELIREACVRLPPTVSTYVKDLVTALNEKETFGAIESFVALYDKMTVPLDLPERRMMDKKSERTTLAQLRAELTQKLDMAETIARDELVKIATVLTHAKASGGCIVDFDLRDIVGFAKCVEAANVKGDIGQMLREVRVAALGLNNDGCREDGEGIATEEQLIEKLTALREFIG